MSSSTLEIKVALQILRTPAEVFEAIADPAQMSNYFISESTGRMETGKTITWQFPEFDVKVPVRVERMEAPRYISYYWDHDDKSLLVEMILTPTQENHTVVSITEKAMDNDEKGLAWLMGNTEGWANFLACLKAWCEHGINLRKGAFDFRRGEF